MRIEYDDPDNAAEFAGRTRHFIRDVVIPRERNAVLRNGNFSNEIIQELRKKLGTGESTHRKSLNSIVSKG